MKAKIHIKRIEKTSDKAICIIALVSWNANSPKERTMWLPKSVCGEITETSIEVETWFLDKEAGKNAFHGYLMQFDGYAAGLDAYNFKF